MSVIGNAVSGLLASQLRVSNAANNIVNADSSNFKPQDVVESTSASGGVNASLVSRDPATVTTLNAQGEIEDAPNVSIDDEVIQSQLGGYDFQANATVIKTEQQLQKRLLDVFA